jgi:ubiquinone/menaquinone biosynthesis C-methylase UbiE
MTIAKLYDHIAATYNQKASANVLLEANNQAFSFIKERTSHLDSILALGIGDGICLLPYQESYPNAKLYGLDISENMLQKASALLDCVTFHGNIAESSSLIKKNDFSLILAHFVSAYVPIPVTLQECKAILAEEGMNSVVTNTLSSFPKMRKIFDNLGVSSNPFNRLVSRHVKQALKTVYVPKNLDHLNSIFTANGFTTHELKLVEININLPTEQDVFDFFIQGGWFASGLAHPLLPKSILHKIIKQLIHRHVTLPYKDHLQIAIAIGSKTRTK